MEFYSREIQIMRQSQSKLALDYVQSVGVVVNVEELQRILSEEISKSIDAQIMNDLKPYIRESKIDTILSKLEEDTNASE